MRHSSAVDTAPPHTADHVRTPTTLGVLGPVEVSSAGTVSRPAAGRQRRLLTVLAVATAQGRSLGPDEFIDAVYGDDPPPRARRSLSTEVWRCRQLLGPDAIQSDHEGYRIDPRLIDIDLVRFNRGVEDGRTALAAGRFADAEQHLTAALALWRGSPLSDWGDHPAGRSSIARLEELQVGGTEDLAQALAGLGQHQDAVALLTPLTRDHPAREHAWSLLIESHLALGDRRRACTALDSVRRTLAEHGVDLGAELRGVREHLQVPGPDPVPRLSSLPVTLHEAGLIGRSESMRRAVATTESALTSGIPEAVVITGEAGIGKTALAERVLASFDARSPAVGTWRISCDERLTLPFATLRPALREHAAEAGVGLPTWLQPGAELPNRADLSALVDEVVTIITQAATASGALVLMVDDAQWASRELLEVLLAVLARPAPLPIAIIATVREPAMSASGESGPTADLLRELRQRATHRLRLDGLTPLQVHEFLGAGVSNAEADRAHQLTGGNPLYLRQLSLAADGTVVRSASLTDALDQRIDSLPLDVLRVLELAAVIGTRFDARVLTTAAAHPPFAIAPDAVFDALDLAARAGLLLGPSTNNTAYDTAFVHALVRDRLYERSPYRQRTASHALIAEALTRLSGADTPSADLLADHSRRAWPVLPTPEVVARLADAGESANGLLAFDEAQRYFQMALDLIAMDPDFDDAGRLEDLLASVGQAAAAAGHPARARDSYESLRQHGLRQQRPLAALRGALGTMWSYAHERIDARAVDHLTAAIDGVLGTAASSDPIEIDLMRDSLSALHAYRPGAERERRPAAIARGPQFRTPLLTALWEQESIPLAREIAEDLITAADGDPLSARIRRWASGIASGTRSFADEPAGLWAATGSRQAQWEAAVWRIATTMNQGDFPRALRLIEDAEQQVGQVNNAVDSAARHAQLLGQRMWIAMQTADPEALAAAARANKPQFTTRRPIMRSAGPLRDLALGDPAAALAGCDRLVDEFDSGLLPAREVHASVVSLSNACLWLQHERGVALCRELLAPHEGEHVLFYLVQYWGSVSHHLGRLALHTGDLDASAHHLTRAIADHERVGARVLAAQSHRFLAVALWRRAGTTDRTDAEHHHAQAMDEATAMGVRDITQQPWPPDH